MKASAIDPAAYQTGEIAAEAELMPALFAGGASLSTTPSEFRDLPGASRARDIAKGMITEAAGILMMIDGSISTTTFLLQLSSALYRAERADGASAKQS